jgi:hypothetical protein
MDAKKVLASQGQDKHFERITDLQQIIFQYIIMEGVHVVDRETDSFYPPESPSRYERVMLCTDTNHYKYNLCPCTVSRQTTYPLGG